MRILTLTNLYPNPLQPHRAAFNRQQLNALAAGHDVSVIAPIAWTDELAARRRGGPGLPADRKTEQHGVPAEHPRYWFPPRVLRGTYGQCFQWSVRRAFTRAVREFGPALVYSPWAYPDGWAAVRLGRAAGLPVVLKVLGSDVLLLSRFPRRARKTVEALRGADGVVAVSQHLADRVVSLGVAPERVRVIYDGVNTERFRPGPVAESRRLLDLPTDEPVLLFVGNLVPVKGLDVLLQACGRLVTAGVRFSCRIVGDGPLRPSLEKNARSAGLGERVKFCGSVAHERLPDWFRAASVVALPSRSEGVPNVLLEAAACGTPFVASRVGGVPEIADLGISRLAPAGDAEALATALRPFLLDDGAAASRPTALRRSWSDSAAELADFFAARLRSRTTNPGPHRPTVGSAVTCAEPR